MSIMQLAEKYRSAYPCAVVGVDVAAGEVGDDPAGHVEAFQKAKDLGLKVTLHAGEASKSAVIIFSYFSLSCFVSLHCQDF